MGWDGRSENVLPRMDWYPQDYLADRKTRGMTLEEHGAYFILLQTEWLDGPLPVDHDELADILATDQDTFTRVWGRVSRCFVERGGFYVNPRMERERVKTLKIREKRRKSGSEGGKAKAKASKCQPSAKQTSSPSPSPSPSAVTVAEEDTPIPPEGDLNDNGHEPEGFLKWYALYPSTAGRAKALLYWTGQLRLITKKKANHEPHAEKIIAALHAQIAGREDAERRDDFVPDWPHANSYLYNRRWEDPAMAVKRKTPPSRPIIGRTTRR